MAYEKQNFKNGEILPADKLNHIEDGIVDLENSRAKIDDLNITTDKAWSSRRIIDTLCPPLEETGNPVVCYPVAGYPLGCKVSWEPTQEGAGDPSPDNIRPIKGRDSVTVERCGENLLNITPFVKKVNKGVTFEYVAPGGIKISGTATGISDSPTFVVPFLPPGSYYGDDVNTINESIVVTRNGARYWQNAKGTFVIKTGDILHYWYISIDAGTTIDTVVYPSIVPGTTPPTAYSPYTGKTSTLTLPTTIYGGTVDAVTGEGQETWKLIDSYAGEGLPGKWISDRDVYASGTAPTTGAQVAYKLAESISFTATGAQSIPALSGVNTVLTDADKLTVTGRADPIKIIEELQKAVASQTGGV